MAIRPAFFVEGGKVVEWSYSLQWFSGFAVSQKQKSIRALHESIVRRDSTAVPLEISTKGEIEFGQRLSAFNLTLGPYAIENIFQSSKVFERGGPYLDLLDVEPRDAKRDERLRNSGRLVAFRCGEEDFPLSPMSAFYDYIWLAAVMCSFSQEELRGILKYSYFTDIEFNPEKSFNT